MVKKIQKVQNSYHNTKSEQKYSSPHSISFFFFFFISALPLVGLVLEETRPLSKAIAREASYLRSSAIVVYTTFNRWRYGTRTYRFSQLIVRVGSRCFPPRAFELEWLAHGQRHVG